jgi:two-component system sensor kinase FixL
VPGDELLDDVIALLGKSEDCRISVSPDFAAIRLNRMPLQQVFFNLIGNAIKHHDKAEKHIAVSVQDDGESYLFTVADDGPGIPKQYAGKVFEMFQTLRPRDQVEGSGMGLAIVRKHVVAMGGHIDLVSQEGQGCAFRVSWPKQPKRVAAA